MTKALRDIQDALTPSEWVDLEFGFAGADVPTIYASIHGIEGYFMIDSGSDSSLINQSIVDFLKLEPKGTQDVVGVDNHKTINNLYEVNFECNGKEYDMTFVGHTVEKLDEIASKQNKVYLGLLGNDFLQANRWVIDYHRMQMMFK